MFYAGRRDLSDRLPDNQYRFYYSALPQEEKDIYDTLLEGYLKHKTRISVKAQSLDEVWRVHQRLCYDVPEVFFLKTVKGSHDPSKATATIYPEYRFDHETCLNIFRRMEDKANLLAKRISVLPDREKVKQIHDYIIRNVTYKDPKAPYSHELPGALLYGIAVCEGIAKAFKYLSDRAGVRSVVVTGESADSTNLSAEYAGHAWNIVFVDACPYHIDVTFDYSVSGGGVIRYDYYLLSDSQIRADHTFANTPACETRHEYYELNGHFADEKKTLRALARNELRPGKPLVVKVPDFREDADAVAERLLAAVASAVPLIYSLRSSLTVSYNSSRMIFQFELQ